jgi:hypothetical protein
MASEARALSADLGVGLAFLFAVLATSVESILALSLEYYFSERVASLSQDKNCNQCGTVLHDGTKEPLLSIRTTPSSTLFTMNRYGDKSKQVFRMPWHRER